MPRVVRVSDIKANLLRPATTSHFEVEIPIIDGLSKWKGVGKQDKMQLMCSEAVLPGSNLATFEINNDRTGVTERHVHRRVFDERIDLTFYVDAGLYQPIKFFEEWMGFITNGRRISPRDQDNQLMQTNYDYRMKYPDTYSADSGLKVRKFEKDHGNILEYEFVRAYPLAINSMPVSYDGSSLLKCNVSLTYIRYVLKNLHKTAAYPSKTPRFPNPFNQAAFNSGGLAGFAGGIVNSLVDKATGNDFLGDLAGGIVGEAIAPTTITPKLIPAVFHKAGDVIRNSATGLPF